MKLQFIKNANGYNDDIVRLSDFNSSQAKLFREVVNTLIINNGNQVDLTTLDFIQPVNCKLTLRIFSEDIGIITDDNKNFYCDLTKEGYLKMIELLDPFCLKESRGYQWLYDIDNPIDFLFSAGGTW
jgi:hypothetical protein